jgi:hypothetical protein
VPPQIAQVYALCEEPEKMFEWLEQAWTTHDGGVIELLLNPLLRAYKDDPTLHRLRAKDWGHAERQSIVEGTLAGSL